MSDEPYLFHGASVPMPLPAKDRETGTVWETNGWQRFRLSDNTDEETLRIVRLMISIRNPIKPVPLSDIKIGDFKLLGNTMQMYSPRIVVPHYFQWQTIDKKTIALHYPLHEVILCCVARALAEWQQARQTFLEKPNQLDRLARIVYLVDYARQLIQTCCAVPLEAGVYEMHPVVISALATYLKCAYLLQYFWDKHCCAKNECGQEGCAVENMLKTQLLRLALAESELGNLPVPTEQYGQWSGDLLKAIKIMKRLSEHASILAIGRHVYNCTPGLEYQAYYRAHILSALEEMKQKRTSRWFQPAIVELEQANARSAMHYPGTVPTNREPPAIKEEEFELGHESGTAMKFLSIAIPDTKSPV
jgi:hypothetical protein